MFSLFQRWLEKQRELRRLWQTDALELIDRDERQAYYTAQRLAARSRAKGDSQSMLHWAKVAAEVARLSPRAEMDKSVVEAIVEEELSSAKSGKSSST
jgi:hypothetical protein